MKSSLTYLAAIALIAATPAIASAQIKTSTDINIGQDASTSSTSTSASSTSSMNIWTGITAAEVSNESDEAAYAQALAKSDTNVSAVSSNAQRVSVSYKTDAKLLGFIPVRMPVTASIYATGATTLNYPWYKFATKGSANTQLETDIKAQTSGDAATNFMISSQDRAVLVSRLYAALRANLSASANANGSVSY